MTGQRDRVTLRRAFLAGGIVWAAVGLPLLLAVAVGGGSGNAGLAAVLLGLSLGGIVTAGWLLLAVFLDLLAGDPPSGARLLWTVAALVGAALCPVLLLAAGG